MTTFWKNELNPKCKVSPFRDKITQATQYPKFWDNGVLVDNPLYAEMYIPFFDITHKEESRKWGVSYTWEISLKGSVILTRDAGHYSCAGLKTSHSYFDIDDGFFPSSESTCQHKFDRSILDGGFNLSEVNKLRAALGLPEVEDFVEY